jgi:outer membrane cobalamin receptor
VLVLLGTQWTAAAGAQPALPKAPDVKVPEVKAPELKAPDLKVPDVKAPAIKPPDAKAPDAKAPDAKAGAEGVAAAPEQGPSAPEDSDVVLFDDTQPKKKDDVPATLPRELERNVGKGANVQLKDRNQGPLTIEEIVDPPVVTASNRTEQARTAPAWVIVVTAKDLRDRGYTDMSQVLNDLPGMDVVRPYGDIYFKSYWRGHRTVLTDSYLVMIDGVLTNNLYTRDTQHFATFPLSNVDHIEIVYGPASAVYGANAAMGVINVITDDGRRQQEEGTLGVAFTSRLSFGGPQANLKAFADTTKIADASLLYTTKDYRFRLTTRLEDSVLDRSVGDRYEMTRSELYSKWYPNPNLVTQYPDLAGEFRSPDRKAAVDGRFYLGKGTEIAAQLFLLSTGYGTSRSILWQQTEGLWTTHEMGVYARHAANLSPRVSSTTQLQFRSSGVATSSRVGVFFSKEFPSESKHSVIINQRSENMSLLLAQDFNVAALKNQFLSNDELSLSAGLRFQYLSLNRGVYNTGYDITEYILFPGCEGSGCSKEIQDEHSLIEGEISQYVAHADSELPPRSAGEAGAYLLGKYSFLTGHAAHLGLRVDHSGISDDIDVTLRGGYVGTFFDKLTLKLLYGQAASAPGSVELAVAPDLREERSQTAEANAEFALPWLAIHAGGYYVHIDNPVVAEKDAYWLLQAATDESGYLRNLLTRDSVGLDLGARVLLRPFQVWAYYSRVFLAEDTEPQAPPGAPQKRPIGDLARDKVWLGATFEKGPFTATVLGRIVGNRSTVSTNPLGSVNGYASFDANVTVTDIFTNGLSLGLRCTNIIGTRYSHPGIWMADAGTVEDPHKAFSSRLPQPGRSFYLTVGLDIDAEKYVGATP